VIDGTRFALFVSAAAILALGRRTSGRKIDDDEGLGNQSSNTAYFISVQLQRNRQVDGVRPSMIRRHLDQDFVLGDPEYHPSRWQPSLRSAALSCNSRRPRASIRTLGHYQPSVSNHWRNRSVERGSVHVKLLRDSGERFSFSSRYATYHRQLGDVDSHAALTRDTERSALPGLSRYHSKWSEDDTQVNFLAP
jgi:hypothetical protein